MRARLECDRCLDAHDLSVILEEGGPAGRTPLERRIHSYAASTAPPQLFKRESMRVGHAANAAGAGGETLLWSNSRRALDVLVKREGDHSQAHKVCVCVYVRAAIF